MQSMWSPSLKNKAVGFIRNLAVGDQKLLISAIERGGATELPCVCENVHDGKGGSVGDKVYD